MKKKSRSTLGMILILGLLLASCGGAEPEAGTGPDVEVAPAAGLVTKLDDVMKAIVQIEAQGTFIDPEFGLQENAAGSGSGFIIDPSGLAVTNNHVVTGAALLKVRLAGEDELRNARILGVSECSDLAVIDIEGEGFSYLEWYEGPINVGLDIYVAGFPLGDPEFTLTRGIISKAKADGESYWSSVDSVVEYDATTNPGNSGGPVVSEDGKVIAVHYSGNSQTRQAFGISRDIAERVVQQLSGGADLDSIGVNGEAVSATDGSFYGIWVSSVKSGSPADEAGLSAGDIILKMEGLDLATDGTMSSYCDILRTHGSDDTLSIDVLRWASGEILTGQLNGRTLAAGGRLGPPSGSSSSGGGYADYTTIRDDTESLEVVIPSSWAEVDGADWTDDAGIYHYSIWAAPSIDSFYNSWETPGLIYEITPAGGDQYGSYLNYLDQLTTDMDTVCSYDGQEDYDDGVFVGAYRLYSACGGTGTGYFVLSAYPEATPQAYSVRIEFQLVSEADWEALDKVLDTFNVIAPVGQALPGVAPEQPPSGGAYTNYVTVTDDFNAIVVDVPVEWSEIDGSAWTYDGEVIGAGITASPDIDEFRNSWNVPGVDFLVSDDLTNQIGYLQLLDEENLYRRDDCEYEGRYDYDDGYYRGKYDYFIKCGGPGGPGLWVLSAVSKVDQFAYLIMVNVPILSDADWDAIDQIVASFDVVGQLP